MPLNEGDSVKNCFDCKKEIFATHQRFYQVPGIPSNAVAYEMTINLPTQGLDVSNSYFHLIYPTLNGNSGTAIGPLLTDYFANSENGILWSDISGIQAVIDFVLPSMGLSVGDVTYAINTTNLPIFFLSSTAVAELVNNTYLHIYWGPTSPHSTYNEKADVTVIAGNSDVLLGGIPKCIPIQEVKEKDSCTGIETYRYITENGAGVLVDVNTVIPGFDEDNVLLSCPEIPIVLEKEVCGTINGSAGTYELIKVYTRNSITGLSTTLFYEDSKGIQITGTVVETCCTCSSICDVPNIIVPQPNQRCIGYSGNVDPNISSSGWMIAGRYDPMNWTGTCGGTPTSFSWELFSCIVNGVELLTTPVVVTVPFASMTLTAAGIPTNYATAFNALPELAGNDIILNPDMASYSWNTAKPFLLGFRQYTSDNACTPALNQRIDFIKGGVSDGWDFATSPNLVDMQTKTMDIYNDPSILYPHQPLGSCIAI